MGGLCGWSGATYPVHEARRALGEMASAGGLGTERWNAAGGASALGAYGATDVHCHEADGIRAVVHGAPHWADASLAEGAAHGNCAAALIEAWRRDGIDCLKRLRGAFALAIVDGAEALIAVDRVGIHPMSFTLANGALVFSSSTTAVVAHPLATARIDAQAVFNYFYFHVVPSPGTIYQGVEKLLPAQYVHFRGGRLERGFYWQLPYRDHDTSSYEAHAERFRTLLREAARRALPDGPMGAFLSGGTDSSTVCGLLGEVSGQPVDSYSIGYDIAEFDEIEYARIAARHFGCRAHEYFLQPDDVVTTIPLVARSYDEPFANDSTVPVHVCARRAAQDGVRTLIAGDGGDELFGGNARYAKQMAFELYGKVPALLRKGLIDPLLLGLPAADRVPLLRKGRSYVRQANIPLPDRMESYNYLYRQPLEEVFEPDFLAAVDTGAPESGLREVYFRAGSEDAINRMLHLDMKFTLADNDLRKVNRMCEAAGVAVRYPLLDEALVEFSGQIPPHYKVRGQQLRWFFKQALSDFLPREILRKSKHGFGLPFGVWSLTHAPLVELVEDSLRSFERRGIVRPDYLRRIRREQADVHAAYFGQMVWVVLTLEQWLQAHGHTA